MNVLFSAGEASGDMYAAALLEEIRKLEPEASFFAIGGPQVKAAGATMVADSSKWGAISIYQSLKVAPRVLASVGKMLKFLRSRQGLFIPIDFGFLNVRLSKVAKARGWKVLYFIPPGSWRRTSHGHHFVGVTDTVITPFPWSEENLRRDGVNAYFLGHPMKEIVERSGAESRRETIAVLPGSRIHEIDNNLEVIAESVRLGGFGQVEFAVSASLDPDKLKARWEALAPGRTDLFTQDDVLGVLKRAKAGIICSGTATLQAALCRCPMVVIYRLSKMMEIEAKLIRFKLGRVSLPNIILDRWAVPELIQLDATAKNIVEKLDALMEESPERKAQLEAFDEIDKLLGPADCLTRTAQTAREMLRRPD